MSHLIVSKQNLIIIKFNIFFFFFLR